MKSLTLTAMITFLLCSLSMAQERSIEKYAEYPGGADKLYDYVQKNLKYPADALKDSIVGDVFVEFIVDAEGNVIPESIKVLNSLSRSCDAEAMRLIKGISQWVPARSRGKGIEQHISFPVSFRIP